MYISASAPEAPPFSDTTIGCFIKLFFWMAACIMRAIWSDAPPAPAATTISTGLVGSHAIAGVNAASIASAPAVLTNLFIRAPPGGIRYCLRGPSLRGLVVLAVRQERERVPDAFLVVRHPARREAHLHA